MTSAGPEPGWYPDPYRATRERYWNGQDWTNRRRSRLESRTKPSNRSRRIAVQPESGRRDKLLVKPGEAGSAVAVTVDSGRLSGPPTRRCRRAPKHSQFAADFPPVATCTCDSDTSTRRRFFVIWVLLPILLVVAPFSFAAMLLWPQAFQVSAIGPGLPKGGVLFFIEGGGGYQTAVDVDVSAWDLSRSGGMLLVKLRFPESAVGKRFFIIPPGQYQIAREADLPHFCGGGAGTAERASEGVKCIWAGRPGVTQLEYRMGPSDQLGNYLRDGIYSVNSLNGYSSDSASIITGVVPPRPYSYAEPVSVFIPVRNFPHRNLGAVEYRSFAGFAVGDPEYGSTALLRPLPDPELLDISNFADGRSGHPISRLGIAKISFHLQEDLGARQLQWSAPAPIEPNSLRWEKHGEGLPGVQLQILDPFEQDMLTRRVFFSGAAVSMAAAGVILIIERWLDRLAHHRRRKKP